MFETVSADDAVSKGQRMINYPVLAIIIGCSVIGIFTGTFYHKTWLFAGGIGGGFIAGWIYWSFMITRWRIWAFDNVRNVHELKKKAIKAKLIWPDDSVFNKTEIRTAEQKEKWEQLQEKFKKEDVFVDNLEVPSETVIHYSKGKNFFEMSFMLLMTLVGIYLLSTEKNLYTGVFLVAIGGFLTFREYRQATNTTAQITLNEKGIETYKTGFYSWDQVENEDVINRSSGKNSSTYLVYDHPEGTEELMIDDYDTNLRDLSNLLSIYRGRFEKKKQG